MEGTIIVKSDEVKELITEWVKSKLKDFGIRVTEVRLNNSYGTLEMRVSISDEPVKEEEISDE